MKYFIIFLFLLLLGPLLMIFSNKVTLSQNWQTANRESEGIAPKADEFREAIVQVYAARAFNWRGYFSLHTWIAIKKENASSYQVYQVLGWMQFRDKPALLISNDLPDRRWFGNTSRILIEKRGIEAEKIIPNLEIAIKKYPYHNKYRTWPGPNSNTFVAYVAREVSELRLAMPSTAVGKDYLPGTVFAKAPSGTGYQFSLFGLFGIMIAKIEGIEVNVLGLVVGYQPSTQSLKLPGIGKWPLFHRT